MSFSFRSYPVSSFIDYTYLYIRAIDIFSDFLQHLLSCPRKQHGYRFCGDAHDLRYFLKAFLLYLSQIKHLILVGGQSLEAFLQPQLVLRVSTSTSGGA